MNSSFCHSNANSWKVADDITCLSSHYVILLFLLCSVHTEHDTQQHVSCAPTGLSGGLQRSRDLVQSNAEHQWAFIRLVNLGSLLY